MKGLRATVVASLAVLISVLPASTALARVEAASFASPGAGEVVGERHPLQVELRWSGRRPDHVDVRLVGADGGALDDTERVRLADCRGDCEEFSLATREATFSGAQLDPATLAPFATGGPRCNGAYGLQARPDGERGWGSGIGFVAQVPPSPPTGVTVTPTREQVEVSWTAAPEPDVVGYTVQRRTGASGSWTTVTETGADTTSVTDRDAPAGDVQYRVTAFRGDGLEGGQPATACTDEGRDLATAAPPVSTTARAGSTTDDGSDAPDDDGSSTPDETGDDGGSDDGTEGSGDGSATSDEETVPAETSTSPRRRAPSTSVESGSRSSVTVPDVATASRSTPNSEDVGGDDGEFSRQIDFGELGESRASGGEGVGGQVALDVPGGLQGAGEDGLVVRRVLGPVAGGMVLLAFGMHLRRWLRDVPE